MKNARRCLAMGLVLSLFPALGSLRALGDSQTGRAYSTEPIKVLNPHRLAAGDVPAIRTPLGIPNDYKPWVTELGRGRLLMVAFCYGGVPSNEQAKGDAYRERAVFRSEEHTSELQSH